MSSTKIDEMFANARPNYPAHITSCPDCNFNITDNQNKICAPNEALYLEYSQNNAYPSAQGEASIKTSINEALEQISVIDRTIRRLNTVVESLKEELARIEDVVPRYRSLLRPVFKLPPELLTRIFTLSTETVTKSLDPSKHPWALSQVCRSWRTLALNTPSLWSLVSFDFPQNSQLAAVSRAYCHRLQLQLQRSKNHPIDILTSTPDATSNSIERYLSPLCAYSPNWRHIRIELDGDVFSPWMASILGRLQSLESLDIRFIAPILANDIECFQFAPKLTSVAFSVDQRILDNVWFIDKLRLPYAQITRYHWQDPEVCSGLAGRVLNELFYGALRRFTHLQSCCLTFNSASTESFHEIIDIGTLGSSSHRIFAIEFKQLRQMEILNVDVHNGIHVVMLIIKAPELEKFVISSSGPDRATLTTFFIHPQKMIHLSIHRVEMPPHEFAAVLTLLPSLTELSFGVSRHGGISDEYLSLLQQTHPATGFFSVARRLQSLSLFPVAAFASAYTTEGLIDLLEARWKGTESSERTGASNSRLLSVQLDKGVDHERLDQLRADGLQVGLWTGSYT